MALRAVPDHPKFASLKAALGQTKGPVLGWLEAIWHFTGRFTPQGNIGKYSDEAIEAWVEWTGKPGDLIAALVRTGWVDTDPVHRLLVHDWAQHAENATKNALHRGGLNFYGPVVRTKGEHVRTEIPSEGTLYGLPEPEPVPVPGAGAEPKDTCAETSSAPALHDGKPLTLPTVDGGDWTVEARDCKGWAEGYPGVNVLNELLKAREWLKANPRNRKTRAGMRRFIVNWLSNAQDRARPGGGTGNEYGNRAQLRTDGNIAAARRAAQAIAGGAAGWTSGGAASECE